MGEQVVVQDTDANEDLVGAEEVAKGMYDAGT